MAMLSSLLLGACAGDQGKKPEMPQPNTRASESIVLGMGCFWGAEKRMAALPGVIDVESGYANGEVEGTYAAVLAQEKSLRFGQNQRRNHAEVVKVSFDPQQTSLMNVLALFLSLIHI